MLHHGSGQAAPIDLVAGKLTIQLARLGFTFARVVLVPIHRDLRLLLEVQSKVESAYRGECSLCSPTFADGQLSLSENIAEFNRLLNSACAFTSIYIWEN